MIGALQVSAPPTSLLIGVVIRRTGGWHTGVLHFEGVEHKILHLAWEGDLRNEAWHPPYAWLAPLFHPIRAQSIGALCRLVWRRNMQGGLPYGVLVSALLFRWCRDVEPRCG